MHRVGVDCETGSFDIDIIATGISNSQHERMRGIVDLIKTLDTGEGANIEDLTMVLQQRGIDRDKIETSIAKLKERGSIFEPGFGRLKAI